LKISRTALSCANPLSNRKAAFPTGESGQYLWLQIFQTLSVVQL